MSLSSTFTYFEKCTTNNDEMHHAHEWDVAVCTNCVCILDIIALVRVKEIKSSHLSRLIRVHYLTRGREKASLAPCPHLQSSSSLSKQGVISKVKVNVTKSMMTGVVVTKTIINAGRRVEGRDVRYCQNAFFMPWRSTQLWVQILEIWKSP
jgi:hypothetical protein